jgi:hypothetical protein
LFDKGGPALEVHPPEHGIHSWRDFLVHMGTIVLGLLIAIGLEQSVEALHHRHQREQLEEDLREESIHNLRIVSGNLPYLDWSMHQLSAQSDELTKAARENRTPVYLPSSAAPAPPFRPKAAVWEVAHANATIGLLPRTEAEQYSRVYSIALENVSGRYDDWNATTVHSTTLGLQARTTTAYPVAVSLPTTFDFSRLSNEDLAAYRAAELATLAATRAMMSANFNLYITTWGALHGWSEDEISARIFDVRTAYATGGIAALQAKYPIPNE